MRVMDTIVLGVCIAVAILCLYTLNKVDDSEVSINAQWNAWAEKNCIGYNKLPDWDDPLDEQQIPIFEYDYSDVEESK